MAPTAPLETQNLEFLGKSARYGPFYMIFREFSYRCNNFHGVQLHCLSPVHFWVQGTCPPCLPPFRRHCLLLPAAQTVPCSFKEKIQLSLAVFPSFPAQLSPSTRRTNKSLPHLDPSVNDKVFAHSFCPWCGFAHDQKRPHCSYSSQLPKQ